jgi:glycosyltransferase involved in cell wall biosynthesis
MKSLKLSICIATYNRSAYIGETLESIIPQLTDETELLVVDGASTDDTEVVMQQYARQDGRIRYVRLPAKGGVDQDYCRAVELAQGEYCWLFTDDDLLKPGAVAEVLRRITDGHCLIIVNAQAMTPDFAEMLAGKILPADTDEVIGPDNIDLLYTRAVSYMSFIGCVVIRRSLWQERDAQAYWGTEFVHVGVIFQAPLPGPALLLAEPFIIIRYGNAQWTSRKFNIWMVKWPGVLWSFSTIASETKQRIMSREPWRSLKEILYYRAVGAFGLDDFRRLADHNVTTCWWRIGAFCCALLPGVLVNALCTLLFFLVRRNSKKLVAYDLTHSRYSLIKS